MHQDTVRSRKSADTGNRRLKQAIDILLDYIFQVFGEEGGDSAISDHPEDVLLPDAGFNSASKSDRRILLPPPEASS